MTGSRRAFFRTSLGAGLLAAADARPARAATATTAAAPKRPAPGELDRIAAEPVLRTDLLKTPIIVASIELLRNGPTLLVRARSRDGAESVTVPNVAHLTDVYPLLLARIAPFFVGKDAPNGGTSASTPVWAALLTRVNAVLSVAKRQRFLTPLLYATGADGNAVGFKPHQQLLGCRDPALVRGCLRVPGNCLNKRGRDRR